MYCGAVALVTSGLLAFVLTHGTGEIRRCGRVFRMPVPYNSIQIGSSENRATFFTIGYPDLQGTFSSRGAGFGWGPAYQDGAMYAIFSTQDEKLKLSALVELRTVYFTQLEFLVEECGSRTCVLPPDCHKNF